MVFEGFVTNHSPLIGLGEFKRLKLVLIFLNAKELFAVFHRAPSWVLFYFFYILIISITLLKILASFYLLTIQICLMLTKI